MEQLKDENATFTALGRKLQVLTSTNISCAYPSVVCRKCRDVINKAKKLQEAYLAEVSKLKSMLQHLQQYAVHRHRCIVQADHGHLYRLSLMYSRGHYLQVLLQQDWHHNKKRLYSQVSRRVVSALLPTLCTPSGISNLRSEQSTTNITPSVVTTTQPTAVQPLPPGPSRHIQSHHPTLLSHTNLTTLPLIKPAPQGTSVMQSKDTSINASQLNAPQLTTSKKAKTKCDIQSSKGRGAYRITGYFCDHFISANIASGY